MINFSKVNCAVGVLALTSILSGCSLKPAYERPEAPIAKDWSTSVVSKQSAAKDIRWKSFIVDNNLRELVNIALNSNRSLRQTLLDIEQARALYRVRRADRLPGLNATADGARERLPADLAERASSGVTSQYEVGLSLPEYEIDLFGRVKNLTEAALEQYLSTEEAGRSARIALIGEVCQTFISYDGAQQRLKLIEKTLGSREESLRLISQRRSVGTANALDYQEALGLVEESRADLESASRDKQQSFNALVYLLGTPEAILRIAREPNHSGALVQEISAGTPSELVGRRPDILAAEHQLKARNADIGAARAAFFPRISLTGRWGTSSAEMSGLFNNGSRSWNFMPVLTLPIFDGGRNKSNLDLATARKDTAVAKYEDTIQIAFREVSDALAATDTLRSEEAARSARVSSSFATLKLAEARYKGGVDSHLRYLDAQRNSFASEMSLISTATKRQIALVDLFRSLGGGWDQSGRS